MKILKSIGVFVGVGILAGVVGCTAAPKAAMQSRVSDDTVDATHPRAELVVGSKELLKKLVLTNVRFGDAGVFPRMQVAMQNVSNKKLVLEYKIEWQDDQGFAVNQNNAWHRFTLTPKQIQNIQSVGKVPEAYSVQVMTRLPEDIYIESRKREQKEKVKWYKF